jgi:hypothetical protein
MRCAAPGRRPTTESNGANALRHCLTLETVIDGLEDAEDYRGFQAAVIAEHDA